MWKCSLLLKIRLSINFDKNWWNIWLKNRSILWVPWNVKNDKQTRLQFILFEWKLVLYFWSLLLNIQIIKIYLFQIIYSFIFKLLISTLQWRIELWEQLLRPLAKLLIMALKIRVVHCMYIIFDILIYVVPHGNTPLDSL